MYTSSPSWVWVGVPSPTFTFPVKTFTRPVPREVVSVIQEAVKAVVPLVVKVAEASPVAVKSPDPKKVKSGLVVVFPNCIASDALVVFTLI